MKKYSRQREIILEVLKNTHIHPTAEQICEMVKEIEPSISRSTVYRNINLLVEEGVIKKLSMPLGPDKFDYIYKPHDHIVCVKCGKIYDFEYDFYNKELSEKIQKETGIETDFDSVTINGICKDCKSKSRI